MPIWLEIYANSDGTVLGGGRHPHDVSESFFFSTPDDKRGTRHIFNWQQRVGTPARNLRKPLMKTSTTNASSRFRHLPASLLAAFLLVSTAGTASAQSCQVAWGNDKSCSFNATRASGTFKVEQIVSCTVSDGSLLTGPACDNIKQATFAQPVTMTARVTSRRWPFPTRFHYSKTVKIQNGKGSVNLTKPIGVTNYNVVAHQSGSPVPIKVTYQ